MWNKNYLKSIIEGESFMLIKLRVETWYLYQTNQCLGIKNSDLV